MSGLRIASYGMMAFGALMIVGAALPSPYPEWPLWKDLQLFVTGVGFGAAGILGLHKSAHAGDRS